MHDADQVKSFLMEQGLLLVGVIASSADEDQDYYAFVKVEFNRAGKQNPSNHKLNRISGEASDRGIRIHFVLVHGEREHLDESLKTMLFGKFPDEVRNSFATFDGKNADVWIEPKRILSDAQTRRIRASIAQFLEFLSFDLRILKLTQVENVPTTTAILRTLRIVAPASSDRLLQALQGKGFIVPNEVWLNHSLDKLRKTGHVTRKSNSHYMLSLQGLAALGTTKGQRQP